MGRLCLSRKLQVSAREGRPQERSEDGVYGGLLEQNRERPKALSRLRSLRAKNWLTGVTPSSNCHDDRWASQTVLTWDESARLELAAPFREKWRQALIVEGRLDQPITPIIAAQ